MNQVHLPLAMHSAGRSIRARFSREGRTTRRLTTTDSGATLIDMEVTPASRREPRIGEGDSWAQRAEWDYVGWENYDQPSSDMQACKKTMQVVAAQLTSFHT